MASTEGLDSNAGGADKDGIPVKTNAGYHIIPHDDIIYLMQNRIIPSLSLRKRTILRPAR